MDERELANMLSANLTQDEIDRLVSEMSTTKTNGIEGMPYQFPKTVDPRIPNTDLGRKYSEKIFARLPLLFLTPCKPLFMPDFSKEDKNVVIQTLLGLVNGSSAASLIEGASKGSSRYYSTEFDYATYYDYLNTMLTCVSAYLGIYDQRITIPDTSISNQQIGKINWQNELSDAYRTFFSCGENVIFYLDSFDSVSESVTNDTTESSIASQINGFTDQLNEVKFLIGAGNGGESLAALGMGGAGELTSTITGAFSGALQSLGGGIVGSLAKEGVNTIFEGGKIIFPEIWSNSDFSRSFNLEIKLRSPDNDNLSIFLNIIKPYCKLLALGLPRQITNDGEADQNSYGSPFLVRAYSKGMFNIDMGIISSMTVNKGATGQWNDDGLPTQLDISLEIKDLYGKFAMSKTNWAGFDIVNVVNNTAYMDFLANMAGLNVGQMEVGRRVRLGTYLLRAAPSRIEGGAFTRLEEGVSRIIGKMYNTF